MLLETVWLVGALRNINGAERGAGHDEIEVASLYTCRLSEDRMVYAISDHC